MPKIEIKSDRSRALGVYGTQLADGFVDGPADEIDAGALYTFEACIDGRWFRWIDQAPVITGDRFRFALRDGTPIAAPSE